MSNFKKYGLTKEEYEGMIAKSGNTCYICGTPPKTRSLNVDHDHKIATKLKRKKQSIKKSVRGLLCGRCNRKLIGDTGDKQNAVQLFLKAAEYIQNYKKSLTIEDYLVD